MFEKCFCKSLWSLTNNIFNKLKGTNSKATYALFCNTIECITHVYQDKCKLNFADDSKAYESTRLADFKLQIILYIMVNRKCQMY